ncbi:hypothetical protein GU700_22700 [Methylobacterium sp. NI91]|nr:MULTISPECIES: hypothetical protein [unclassified Methylobacterium]QIJ77132.1 hypothetical protein CLZ_22705 [Methylobacterium sp. CLZ]QIJ82036.1 hypothetical protein GU700_22700 [Methylobacterium sp. NI91]
MHPFLEPQPTIKLGAAPAIRTDSYLDVPMQPTGKMINRATRLLRDDATAILTYQAMLYAATRGEQGETLRVPRVPTPEMIEAGSAFAVSEIFARSVWEGMIEAVV